MQPDGAEQSVHGLRRLSGQAAVGVTIAFHPRRRGVDGGRFQVVIGPLGGDPSHLALCFEQFLLELRRGERRHLAVTEAFDEPTDAFAHGPPRIFQGQLGSGVRVRRRGADGCQRQGEVSRVRHGGVLSCRAIPLPAVTGKAPPIIKRGAPANPTSAARGSGRKTAIQAHGRDCTLARASVVFAPAAV